MDGDVLPALYFLGLFMLEQYRFLEVQEAYIFDEEEEAMRPCPLIASTDGAGAEDTAPLECAICQVDDIGRAEYVYKLGCGHKFHRWCLVVWLIHEGRSNCPLCRGRILFNDVCIPALDPQQLSLVVDNDDTACSLAEL
ncbi:uncharacterized protein Z520_00277 [Fonsecaea multimorphosa CBS 102226]|uniref:RING-type domain-containing protein n=1 Tax=Fonsecaea multimorphosa CBS 102226 TaxID=1442371 RepID=A0A0D2HP28_9EURO|nr:uncharacterized protein Z520_00277 [Fonsecaea multimorphosa CBS 102226]KIY03586.1 hypothetical protein Z520_00277 [Fonsecaea multimorphosa CBS 102226]OAL32288.1 hypothetical protein AYO22_00310 [Fonsecaea multimorphosa]